jgi:hypothetical protein
MQKCDQERASKVEPTDFAKADKKKAEGLLAKAQEQMDNDLDDVKNMN